MILTAEAMRAQRSLEQYIEDESARGFFMPGIVGALAHSVYGDHRIVKRRKLTLREKLSALCVRTLKALSR